MISNDICTQFPWVNPSQSESIWVILQVLQMILTHWFAIYDEDQDGQLQLEAGWDREISRARIAWWEKLVACCCAVHMSTPRLLKFSNFAQPGLRTAGCWLSATLDRCRWDLHKGRQRTTRWTGFLITRRWWDIPFSCYEFPWTWKINDDHLSSLY